MIEEGEVLCLYKYIKNHFFVFFINYRIVLRVINSAQLVV